VKLAKIGAPVWKTARYLRMTTELWGRSYAQYVALKSSDGIMKSEVQRFGSHPDPLLANRQWSERSFAPIAEAIEAILQSKGSR